MATATPNILINSIRGRIGNVVFYTRRGRQCVRVHVIPRNPDTEAQRVVRRAFGDAVRSWQAMSPDEQYTYTRKARHLNMSGYNLFISGYMILKQNRTLARAEHRRGWPAVRLGWVRAQANNHPSTDGSNLNTNSPSWNLELATWNSSPLLERIPSVSPSYMLLSGINTRPKSLNLSPG